MMRRRTSKYAVSACRRQYQSLLLPDQQFQRDSAHDTRPDGGPVLGNQAMPALLVRIVGLHSSAALLSMAAVIR